MRTIIVFLIIVIVIARVHAQAERQSADAGSSNGQSAFADSLQAHRIWAGSDGLHFSTDDGANTLHVHGYLQADDRFFLNNLHGEGLDVFLFRRIRPLFEGTIFHSVDFRFMPDFGQNNPQIQEAYLEWKEFPWSKLRIGKFKEPIGLEILQQDRQLIFAERSMASDLLPLRYMGIQVEGSDFSNRIEYEAGYFNGSNDGSNGNFEWLKANEVAARLFLHPFAATWGQRMRGFGIGIAGSDGHQHGPISGLKTVGQNTFFKYVSAATANGPHSRIAPQAYYYAGPVGLISEYVISSQDVRDQTSNIVVKNAAWQFSGSFLLTGEKNHYEGVIPRRAFDIAKGFRYFGALEFAARFSRVRLDRAAFPALASPASSAQQATEVGIGMNWILNRFVKLTTDYEDTTFRMEQKNAAALPKEEVLMSRVQLAF
jgi:phosphate-selective porin OprO/OprP